MNDEIMRYHSQFSIKDQNICQLLAEGINTNLPDAQCKIWHGSPVWFIDDNPIVGYAKLKDCIQLLFWSGQSFGVDGLQPVGKYKAAEVRYVESDVINTDQLSQWLKLSSSIQWDYRNIVKRRGELLRLK